MSRAKVYQGDCLELLRLMPDCSVDAVVTDPPYGLSDHKPGEVEACLAAWLAGKEYRPNKRGFMGRSWDAWVPGPEVWRECLRVLKPGGHLLAFFGTRTQDIGTLAIRLAGFEVRDSIAWVYGSGFPKSMDVSKAIERVPVEDLPEGIDNLEDRDALLHLWSGWGTALKPALEPITVARKPLQGTVAVNVLAHGTGAINIDACRVPSERPTGWSGGGSALYEGGLSREGGEARPVEGRWPANLVHDGSDEVLALFPDSAGSGGSVPNVKVTGYGNGVGSGESACLGGERTKVDSGSGSAARFFYCAKASRRDRDEGLEGFNRVTTGDDPAVAADSAFQRGKTERANHHPTVKPTALMRYLCRLVTPPGGDVLDPFTGSGSTGKAAVLEGFGFIGFEADGDNVNIARARIIAAEAKL